MIIYRDSNNHFRIGKDLAEAASAPIASHGFFEVTKSANRYEWQSTLSQQASERVIRKAVKAEQREVTFFQSQAV